MLNLRNFLISLVVAAVVGIGGGVWLGGKLTASNSVKPAVVKPKVETRVEIKKPDGTVITKQITESPVVVAPDRNAWSLGFRYPVSKFDTPDWKPVGVELGHRFIWDLWGTLGFRYDPREFDAGVRYEW